MATNIQGIAITIKAFLPTGKTLDEQFEALSIVKDAHASGDYAALLTAAKIDEVRTEQKVRRIEDAPAATTQQEPGTAGDQGGGEAGTQDGGDTGPDVGDPSELADAFNEIPPSEPDEEVPAFLRKGKTKAA